MVNLEGDLTKITAERNAALENSSKSSASTSQNNRSSGPRTRRNFLIRFQRSSSDRSSNSNDEGPDASPAGDDENEPTISVEEADSRSSIETVEGGREEGQQSVIESTSSNDGGSPSKVTKRNPGLSEYEKEYKLQAVDYEQRFCGHCNTTTDIKEANFFGNFIVAGSDDGSFFIWDRETTNIVKIVKGDESIVNCLQPHPNSCCLATSGIESVVRIWCPLPEVFNYFIFC